MPEEDKCQNCKQFSILKRLIDSGLKNFPIQEMVIQDGHIVKIKLIIGNKEVEILK